MYLPKHFKPYELVPKSVIDALGELWLGVIDERILIALDRMREHFNRPIIVNNWYNGGQFLYRGFRPAECSVGAAHSQHRYGRAADFDVSGLKPEIVRGEIKAHQSVWPMITAMESGTSWVHVDCRNTGKEGITVFKP